MDVAKKKVGLFLRVSTQQQASKNANNDADIPEQRSACMRLINQHTDWELVKEYVEVGSAFKNTLSKRDKLLEVQSDIENGDINVLVTFMFDRIGRIEEETPFVVQNFVQMGAEVWSAREGQRTFDSHVDNLINYITFWQAGGESKKTSMRVSSAMTELARKGEYIGGKPPYGYIAVETGGTTKKGLPQRTFMINEDEAKNVRLMYQLAASRNYGCHRIASYLNEQDIKTKNGKQWGNAMIANILRNPIYKGLKAYNRTTGKGQSKGQKRNPQEKWVLPENPNPEWAIVSEELWEQVRQSRDKIVAIQKEQQEYNQTIPDVQLGRTKLLFIGYIYCGSCGAAMNTGYSPYRWRTADGVQHRRDNPVYKCRGRASGKLGCTGKSSYKPDLIEGLVLEEIYDYLGRLEKLDLTSEIERIQKENTQTETKAIKSLNRDIEKLQKEISSLENEVVKAIMGESEFDKGMLSRMIDEKTALLSDLQEQLKQAERVLKQKVLEQADLLAFQKMIPIWQEEFEQALTEEKKVMLSKIIKRITVYPDEVKVELSMTFQQFLQSADWKPLPPDGGGNNQPQEGENLTRFGVDRRPYRCRQGR